ncbi:hypothetical protein TNCV_3175481 [Trichonephila clavipes]|nr:hypothetical protein TNCV_3175481 [Trichonephila clavipes]
MEIKTLMKLQEFSRQLRMPSEAVTLTTPPFHLLSTNQKTLSHKSPTTIRPHTVQIWDGGTLRSPLPSDVQLYYRSHLSCHRPRRKSIHWMFANLHHNLCKYGSLRGIRYSEDGPHVTRTPNVEQNMLDTVQRNPSIMLKLRVARGPSSLYLVPRNDPLYVIPRNVGTFCTTNFLLLVHFLLPIRKSGAYLPIRGLQNVLYSSAGDDSSNDCGNAGLLL